MPQVLTWHATTKGGRAVVRGDGHRESSYSEMTVDTDHALGRIRVAVDPARGENCRAFTRRVQRQNLDGAVMDQDSVPVVEVTTQAGERVRVYLYADGVVVSTADLYR